MFNQKNTTNLYLFVKANLTAVKKSNRLLALQAMSLIKYYQQINQHFTDKILDVELLLLKFEQKFLFNYTLNN